jgi:hypothetical protein
MPYYETPTKGQNMHKIVIEELTSMALLAHVMSPEQFSSYNQFLERFIGELCKGTINSSEDMLKVIIDIAVDMCDDDLDEI